VLVIVVALVFVIALLNLALGMGVAIVAARDDLDPSIMLSSALALLRNLRRGRHSASLSEEDHAAAKAVIESSPIELPAGWNERLADVQPPSLAEAMLHMVRLENASQFTRWLAVERSLRVSLGSNDAPSAALFTALRSALDDSAHWVNQFLELLRARRDELNEEELVRQFEDLLLDEADSLKLVVTQDYASLADVETPVRRALRDLQRVFDKSFLVRDFVLDQLAQRLAASGRAAQASPDLQRHASVGSANRIGAETYLAEFRAGDSAHKRLLSGALVEIDRLSKLNERLGVQQTDLVMRAFGRLLETIVRRDRGDRVAWIGGPTFFLLLVDTAAPGAKAAAERVRQTVEAATFVLGGDQFTIASNCAVAEMLVEDSLTDTIARLQLGIAEAKQGGRNRTAIDEGQGPTLFEPEPMHVKARMVEVSE
jgi:diguanylate cyclase (GGDEF)-like protein